jgi:hypothetical protein
VRRSACGSASSRREPQIARTLVRSPRCRTLRSCLAMTPTVPPSTTKGGSPLGGASYHRRRRQDRRRTSVVPRPSGAAESSRGPAAVMPGPHGSCIFGTSRRAGAEFLCRPASRSVLLPRCA